MRQLLLFLVFLGSILSCTSCRKEPVVGPSATVTVSIKTVFGDEPFIAGELYDYPSEGRVEIEGLALFLSDISLVSANGTDEVALDEIAHLNVSTIQYDVNSANKGWVQSYYKVPVGDYNGVKFGLGVAYEDNLQNPEHFSTGSPLGNDAHYSNEYESYIFEDVGGRYCLPGDTTAFTIKIVKDKMFAQVDLNKSFTVEASSNEIEITFDLKKVFGQNDSILNLADYPVVTSPLLPQMNWLVKNFQHSFSF